jgi:hypothetical protein
MHHKMGFKKIKTFSISEQIYHLKDHSQRISSRILALICNCKKKINSKIHPDLFVRED